MNKLMNMSKKAKIFAGLGLIGFCALIAGLSFWAWSNSGVRVEDLSKEYKQVVKSLDGDIFTAESLRVVCAENKSLDGVNRCEQAKVLENIKAAKEVKKAEIPTSVAQLEKSLDSAKEVKEKLANSISNAEDALGKDADKYRSEVVVPLIEALEDKIAQARKLAADNSDNGETLVHKPGELAHVLNIKADELGKDVERISKNMRDEKVFISQLQDIAASLKSSLESLNEAFVMVQNAIGVEPEKQAPVVVPSQKVRHQAGM
ncbi:hypothetical protein RQN30_10200 [Arcanobacterium hippocoleae]